MSRLFICGITCAAEIEKIKDLISKTKDYVDGFVWCVDEKDCDEIYQFLNDNKKEGKIVQHPWCNAHDWQMNEFLHCGVLKEGDCYWIFDSSECPTEKWLNQVQDDIKAMKSNNIGIIGCSGRPYLVEFQDTQFFQFNPHWALNGTYNRKMMLIPEDKKDEFIINKRHLNPDKHYQEHDTKYYLYARSNQIQMFYGKYGQEIVNFHEKKRIEFRNYLREKTKLEPSLRALDIFFEAHNSGFYGERWTEYEIEMMELEFCLSEYFQRKILGMDFMGKRPEISNGMHPRKKWSFKNHLEFGDGWINKDYEGTIIKYNK